MLIPLNPLLYSKTGVNKGIHYFSNFCSKHRLWVLIRTASPLCFEQKYENYKNILSENFQVLEANFPVDLNRRVFVRVNLNLADRDLFTSECQFRYSIYITSIIIKLRVEAF